MDNNYYLRTYFIFNVMKISDKTSVSMPMKNLISIVGAVAVGVWAYFGVIERINTLETDNHLIKN